MEDLIICRAAYTELEEILSLQKTAYLSEAAIYEDYSIPPLHQTLEDIRKEFETMVFLKAVSGSNQIIGSVRLAIRQDTGIIFKLIVDERFCNLGIGKQLLSAIETLVKDKVTRFELFTGFDSIKNLHIYISTGYKEFRRERLTDKITLVFLEKPVF